MRVERAVAVGVFVDRDAIVPAERRVGGVRRRRGERRVVDVPPHAVAAEQLQARGPRVLPILDDPQPAALVETQVKRLFDRGFAEHKIQHKVVAHQEGRLVRAWRRD